MNKELKNNDVAKNLLLYIIFLFPLTSLIKTYLGPINMILTAISFALMCIVYIRNNIKLKNIILLLYIFLTFVINIYLWGFEYYNENMIFYFPFLILYFLFFVDNKEYIKNFITSHQKYLKLTIFIYSLIILITLLLPSCYVYEGESRGFVSIAGTTFLLCPISIYMFVIICIMYIINRKKIYLILLMIPSISILMGTTRTYLVVLLCAWLIFLYAIIKNKRKFLPLMISLILLFLLIVIISPIKDKFITTMERVENLGLDPLEAFTSGRSEFWAYDIKSIFNSDILYILFGHGVNYLFYLNEPVFNVALWAHNDYIQILSDYGILGLIIYIEMFVYLFKRLLSKDKKNTIIVCGICILMWVFNAFFNMFYTYFCACLSYPFYLLILENDTKNKFEGEK